MCSAWAAETGTKSREGCFRDYEVKRKKTEKKEGGLETKFVTRFNSQTVDADLVLPLNGRKKISLVLP